MRTGRAAAAGRPPAARVLFITAPPALFVVRLALPGISVLDRIR